jgi:hypothetical protein
MDINEALDAMSGLFDSLYSISLLTDEEAKLEEEIESTITNYVKSKGDYR